MKSYGLLYQFYLCMANLRLILKTEGALLTALKQLCLSSREKNYTSAALYYYSILTNNRRFSNCMGKKIVNRHWITH